MSQASLTEFKEKIAQQDELPYCSGTAVLDPAASALFYKTETSNAAVIDFTNPTAAQIEDLAKACQPATFGMNQQDVLDETYRKAGKMDVDKFATQFSPADLGIASTINEYLLKKHAGQPFRAELYKLNVYGPGAFFKSHVDTPRSETMFGSLVVVLPTVHEGGSLGFRHRQKEWTFESSKSVNTNPPQVAFTAFFSDVEHEVLPVISGYRVTLTYNLYFLKTGDDKTAIALGDPTVNEDLEASLGRLLKDPTFLPEGGSLGFGLSHKYSFNPKSTRLRDILGWLKGPDAGWKNLCEALSLEVVLKAVYHEGGQDYCLLDNFYDFKYSGEMEDGMVYSLAENSGAQMVYDPDRCVERPEDATPILWVKPLASVNQFDAPFIAYGNQASLAFGYGEVCLVAKVAPIGERAN